MLSLEDRREKSEDKSQMTDNGVILISTFIFLLTLTVMVTVFLYLTSIQTLSTGYGIPESKALWLAEAGLQKAVWSLKTPLSAGGRGENWTTTGTTESLGSGSYTVVVARWDFALAANGASASASSSNGANVPARAIDGNNATFWESAGVPSAVNPQFITLAFPYPLTLNKVSFLSPTSATRPGNYSWQVSSNNVGYTTVLSVSGNGATNVTNTFVARFNVNYLRLRVTQPGTAGNRVRIARLEAIGSKITSTGTVSSLNRKIEQTVVADDGSPQHQVAYNEIDWTEIVPA